MCALNVKLASRHLPGASIRKCIPLPQTTNKLTQNIVEIGTDAKKCKQLDSLLFGHTFTTVTSECGKTCTMLYDNKYIIVIFDKIVLI